MSDHRDKKILYVGIQRVLLNFIEKGYVSYVLAIIISWLLCKLIWFTMSNDYSCYLTQYVFRVIIVSAS